MKLLVLTLLSLVPFCSKAQTLTKGFESGYYILADEPTVRHTGQMRIEPFGPSLRVKQEGKVMNQVFKPAQLLACGTEKVKYVIAKDFLSGRAHIDADFAQQLDSGQIVLLNHSRVSGAGGGISIFLVRRPSETAVTVLDAFKNQYRQQILPFIASRPDLVQLVQEKKFTYDNLYALIHAFNTGQPYALGK